MRELKFRVWNKHSKEWLMLGATGIDCITGYLVDYEYEGRNFEHQDWYVIEQYTGLKDKNGKEIYEGDIVKDKWSDSFYKGIYEVKYGEERAGFVPFAKGDGCGCCESDTISDSSDVEIVGNIHENPGLLEDEE